MCGLECVKVGLVLLRGFYGCRRQCADLALVSVISGDQVLTTIESLILANKVLGAMAGDCQVRRSVASEDYALVIVGRPVST